MRFKRIYIEVINTCNLSCSFCIQNQREPRIMEVTQFSNILSQMKPYCEYIYLHVLGEPLSHPQLNELLDVANDMGIHVNITTNGTLLAKQKEVLKTHTIRQINVSLHSFPQHMRAHYFEDVFSVCEELASLGVYINYRLWSIQEQGLQSESEDILKDVLKRYNMSNEEVDIKRLQRISLQKNISLHFEEVFAWPSLQHPFVNETGRCLGMKDMCAILSNGEVVPCCLDSKGECSLGNIYEQSFEDIITSSKAQTIVEGFFKGKIEEELCKHCSYRLRFSK
ncbi:MAG: radical SAM protein [Longicatena sp.]